MKLGIFCCILIVSFSCSSKKKEIAETNEFKLERLVFARYDYSESSPFMQLEINRDKNYAFYGRKYSDTTGFYKGQISDLRYAYIEDLLSKSKVESADSLCIPGPDIQEYELIVYYNGNKRKSIIGSYDCFPGSLDTLKEYLMDSYKQIKLTQTDTIKFETTILPSPIRKQIKFVPPEMASPQD